MQQNLMGRWTKLHGLLASTNQDVDERIHDFTRVGETWWTVSDRGLIRRLPVSGEPPETDTLIWRGQVVEKLSSVVYSVEEDTVFVGVEAPGERPVFPRLLSLKVGTADWKEVPDLPLHPASGIVALAAKSGNIFAVGADIVGQRPGVWRHQSSAPGWTALDAHACAPRLTMLTDIHMFDEFNGILVGCARDKKEPDLQRPIVLTTRSAGEHWHASELPALPPVGRASGERGRYAWSVQVSNNLVHVAVSSYSGSTDRQGLILRSLDRGENWELLTLSQPENKSLQAVGFIDAQTGWAGGHYDPVYATTDGGLTWSKHPGLKDGNRFAMYGDELFLLGNGFYRLNPHS